MLEKMVNNERCQGLIVEFARRDWKLPQKLSQDSLFGPRFDTKMPHIWSTIIIHFNTTFRPWRCYVCISTYNVQYILAWSCNINCLLPIL